MIHVRLSKVWKNAPLLEECAFSKLHGHDTLEQTPLTKIRAVEETRRRMNGITDASLASLASLVGGALTFLVVRRRLLFLVEEEEDEEEEEEEEEDEEDEECSSEMFSCQCFLQSKLPMMFWMPP